MDFSKWRNYLDEKRKEDLEVSSEFDVEGGKVVATKTPSKFKDGMKVSYKGRDGVIKNRDVRGDFVLVSFNDGGTKMVPYSGLEIIDGGDSKEEEDERNVLQECGMMPQMMQPPVDMPTMSHNNSSGIMVGDSRRIAPHDDEGRMAKSDLYKIAKYAMELSEALHDEDELEGWVQAKITKAADYLSAVKHYLEYEFMNPQEQMTGEIVPVMEASKKKVDELFKKSQNIKSKVAQRVEALEYHLNNKVPITENVFRVGSEAYINLISDAKALWRERRYTPTEQEKLIFETRIGEWGEYNGRKVPLDCPMIYESRLDEAEYHGKQVSVGKPQRGGAKKFYVYVMCGGKIKKISFGDPNLSVKVGDPERRKSFVARHKCTQKNDRCSAGYWSCRIGRYPNLTGAKQRYTWW